MGALLLATELAKQHGSPYARPRVRNGAGVFHAAFAASVLKYSKRNPIYFLESSYSAPMPEPVAESTCRLRPIHPLAVRNLSKLDNLVLISTGPNLHSLSVARGYLKGDQWPVVGFIHSLNGGFLLPWFASSLMELLGPNDALVCSSISGKTVVERLFSGMRQRLRRESHVPFRLPVIPLGIECSDFQSIDRMAARVRLDIPIDRPAVLYLGRLSPDTKADLAPLLIAFSRVSAPGPPPLLVLAGGEGQPGYVEDLRRLAAALDCEPSVIFKLCPSEVEKRWLLAAADIFVAPSDNVQETFGIAVAEAMAAGLPVLASDWDGYRELVQHGSTGFLVPTYFPPTTDPMLFEPLGLYGHRSHGLLAATTAVDVHIMQGHLQELISNRQLRRRMGEAASRQAQTRLDWRVVVNQYDELWDELESSSIRRPLTCRLPLRCDYLTVFEKYATSRLNDDTVVELGPAAYSAISTECTILRELLCAGSFDPEILVDIMDVMKGCVCLGIRALIANVRRRRPARTNEIEAHVARLLKYGLLTVRIVGPNE